MNVVSSSEWCEKDFWNGTVGVSLTCYLFRHKGRKIREYAEEDKVWFGGWLFFSYLAHIVGES